MKRFGGQSLKKHLFGEGQRRRRKRVSQAGREQGQGDTGSCVRGVLERAWPGVLHCP